MKIEWWTPVTSKIADFLRSPHIQLALAQGASIIALSAASKRLLPEPIGALPQAFPAVFLVACEFVQHKYKGARIARTRYWVLAILLATALVIVLHLPRVE